MVGMTFNQYFSSFTFYFKNIEKIHPMSREIKIFIVRCSIAFITDELPHYFSKKNNSPIRNFKLTAHFFSKLVIFIN